MGRKMPVKDGAPLVLGTPQRIMGGRRCWTIERLPPTRGFGRGTRTVQRRARNGPREAGPTLAGVPNDALIVMHRVAKIYDTPAGEFLALKGIDLRFRSGELVCVVGRSGSGKTTLVNMITGIDHPTSGQVIISGMRIHDLSESRMARWRGRNLGIVFQFFQLLPTLTLLENVMLPMDLCETYPPAEREPRALALLERVGLARQAHMLPASVSGGQQQSAAIARALANDPPIIVADEPTGNLDSRSAAVVLGIFEELSRRGKTIIIVTHDRRLARRASRIVVLADGQLTGDHLSSQEAAAAAGGS